MSLLAHLGRRPSDWHGSLAFLSIVHCPLRTDVPSPLDNVERYHEFRKRWRSPIGNTWSWPQDTTPESRPARAGDPPGA